MNTTINNSGDGNVINTGSNNKVSNKVSVYKEDIDRLQNELRKQGIDDSDIQEVIEIVGAEEPNKENNRLGSRVNGWISNIINKTLNGVGGISNSITVDLLATLIKQYYGIE